MYACRVHISGLSLTQAVEHTITISGLSYTPSVVNANVGDVVTISASGTHPLVQVDQSTWDSNSNTPIGGGWGTETSEYSFTILALGDIYYVCANHVGSGMKGMISVSSAVGITDLFAENGADVFPSVSTDGRFTINVGSDLTNVTSLDVYSLNGTLVKTLKLNAETTVLNTDLASGSYVFLIGNGSDMVLRKKVLVVRE